MGKIPVEVKIKTGMNPNLDRERENLLVEAVEGGLHVLHGEDTDGRALRGPPVPTEEVG